MSFAWPTKRVLVTGGASFIGSHLVDALVARAASVRVVDDFSSGTPANLADHVEQDSIHLMRGDLRDPQMAARAIREMDVVFHLAADHGGRGYVDTHQYDCSTNLGLDAVVFGAAVEAGVEKVVYASSGCVYPLSIQVDPDQPLYLSEDMVGPPYEPDGMYGLAKLAGEMTLKALHAERGLGAASCRYFTVYGPRGVENHAVIAMIARAFIRQDPYYVWGTGEQIRNWTYVSDIVEGTIAAAECIDDGTAVNLGTTERVRVLDAVAMVLRQAAYDPAVVTQPDMPTGPYNRVADNRRAAELLGWRPRISFAEGLRLTQTWYGRTKDAHEVRRILGHMLTGRGQAMPATVEAVPEPSGAVV